MDGWRYIERAWKPPDYLSMNRRKNEDGTTGRLQRFCCLLFSGACLVMARTQRLKKGEMGGGKAVFSEQDE